MQQEVKQTAVFKMADEFFASLLYFLLAKCESDPVLDTKNFCI